MQGMSYVMGGGVIHKKQFSDISHVWFQFMAPFPIM